MKQYKTGELAKMADVSIRTIRYYDSIGLLKPSKIEANGYRIYTDNDFWKLQKILSLKYLGFSLEEIFSLTINDSSFSIQDSLNMQTKLIKQKIEYLKRVEVSLKQTAKLIEKDNNIDWTNILKAIKITELEKELIEQYKNATNVTIRINLHDKYGQNPIGWFEWLFKQYQLKGRVLEIGCGNGYLWKKNQQLLKKDFKLVLSDISDGMLIDAKQNLTELSNVKYQQIDIHNIPFSDNSFDVIIANHVLFYAKDLEQVLKEVTRVLKKNGVFYCSTYGKKHMKEITDIVKEYDSRITLSKISLYDIFGLDDGDDILNKYFDEVKLLKYDDFLKVDNVNDLISYILSCHGNQTEYILKNYEEFKKHINNKFKVNNYIKIGKESGLFVCQKNN